MGAAFQAAVYGAGNATAAITNTGNAVTRWDRLVAAALPNMGRFGNAAMNVSGALGGITSSMAIASIATVGLIAGSAALYKISEAGSQIEYTRQKFDRLSESMGTTGDLMLGQLRVATKGTLSDFQLTKQGTDLFQLGLAKTTEEAVRLSTVMTALGMDTGELTLALANQSKRRLDQLGISLTEFNKNEALFKAKGLSKEDAFTQAFLTTAEQTVERVGNKGDSAAGSFERLSASWTNLKDSVKLASADTFTGFNNTLSRTVDKFTELNRQSQKYRDYLISQGKFTPTAMTAAAVQNFAELTKDDRPRIPGVSGATAAPKIDTTDYANLLKVGTSLTDMTAKYNDKLNQLAEKLIDAPKKFGATAEQAEALKNSLTGLNSMSTQYNATLMQQLQQLTSAEGAYGKNDARVRDLREGIAKLKEEAVQANNEMLLGTMANAGATDQQQADFARASGMISEQAWQQATALAKISQAYLSNKISADQAAAAARGVANGMSSINGFNAVGYVDIYIRVHGSMPGGGNYAGPNANNFTTSNSLNNLRKNTGGGNASGGPVGANEISGITEYGEPEIFSSGGKQYLVTGKRGGYVSPMNAQTGGSFNQMHALVSRIPTAEENARALVKALKAVS